MPIAKKANLEYAHHAQQLAWGDFGFIVLTDTETSAADERFACLYALATTVITFTNDPLYQGGTLVPIVSLTIPAGSAIYGNFKTLTVTTGSLICYLRQWDI